MRIVKCVYPDILTPSLRVLLLPCQGPDFGVEVLLRLRIHPAGIWVVLQLISEFGGRETTQNIRMIGEVRGLPV